MDDLYNDVSIDMDILRECYAALLADFARLFDQKDIDFENDPDNVWVKLFREAQERFHKIFSIRSMAKVNEFYGAYNLMHSLVKSELEKA